MVQYGPCWGIGSGNETSDDAVNCMTAFSNFDYDGEKKKQDERFAKIDAYRKRKGVVVSEGKMQKAVSEVFDNPAVVKAVKSVHYRNRGRIEKVGGCEHPNTHPAEIAMEIQAARDKGAVAVTLEVNVQAWPPPGWMEYPVFLIREFEEVRR